MARPIASWEARVDGARVYVDGIELEIPRPERLLWPAEGITKRDLVLFYLGVAPFVLPYLAERPITMQTFPRGVGGSSTYIKQRPRGSPEWVREACLPARAGHTVCYVLAKDEPAGVATLAWLAARTSIPLHAWLSRVARPDKPDWVAFDLDPAEGARFAQVVRIARWLSERLASLGLRSFAKVSGSRGIHVLVPLRPAHGYDEVRSFALGVAEEAVRELPDDATLHWPLRKRQGRVFVDVRRNTYGATLVAPYSVRARPGAPVSVPIDWRELDDPRLAPDRWDMPSTLERLRRLGDPLAAAYRLPQRLPAGPRA